jgi:succinate dehydrogenase / fumarate reductase flavoprotein subunit
MEVGPTCHYIMGGIRVDADSATTTVPGLFAAGEVAGGLHGANRLGGNSLSDLLVFGRRAGMGAAEFAECRPSAPDVDTGEVYRVIGQAMAPLRREEGENPYDIQRDLQEMMHRLVGIIRTESELIEALGELQTLTERTARMAVSGGVAYNPAWNLATDLPAMLAVSTLVAKGALERRESRGGHTREDYPGSDAELGKVNLVQRLDLRGDFVMIREPLHPMPEPLAALLAEEVG